MPTRPAIHRPMRTLYPGGAPTHTRKAYDRFRGSAAERGYDAAWARFRAQYLRANPLCMDCLEASRTAAARDVHHIKKLRDFPELKYEESNLRGLCKSCHSARTARGE